MKLKYLLPLILLVNPGAYAATSKLSQVNNGGTIVTGTDQCVAVRSGTTDELVSFGALAALANAPAGSLTGTTLNPAVVSSSLTSVGTIGTGVWNGTSIAVANGGTGASSASITAFNNITGYTASGATGTTSTNLVFSASPTFTGTVGAAAQTNTGIFYLNGGVAEESLYSNGSSGTSLAINLDNGNTQSTTITGAVAITLTTPTHPGKMSLVVTQDGSGHVYSITGCKWAGGTPFTYSTAASAIDIISIIYNGTSFFCSGGGAFS